MQSSINNRALLIKLSIGMPGNTRKDPKLTSEVTTSHNMQEGAGRWSKNLYPEAALEPLAKLGREAREYFYTQTLPWSDEGWRILPTASHFEFSAKMRTYRNNYQNMTETHFIARYEEFVLWAKVAQNGSFDPANYPPVEKLRSKFRFETEAQAIPSAEDFRVDLSNEEVAQLQGNVDQRVKRAIEDAQKDLWNRLIDPVRCMVERLKDPDSKFKDSLVGNLREIVALVPKLNLSNDPMLNSFRDSIDQQLAGFSPQVLRDSKPTRAEAAQRAQEILDKMSGYMA